MSKVERKARKLINLLEKYLKGYWIGTNFGWYHKDNSGLGWLTRDLEFTPLREVRTQKRKPVLSKSKYNKYCKIFENKFSLKGKPHAC